MGSLPNLHELEETERRREKRRERELLQQHRANEYARERERLALMIHCKPSSYNSYLTDTLNMGSGGTLGMSVVANNAPNVVVTSTPSLIPTATATATGISTSGGGAVKAATAASTTTNTLNGLALGGSALLGMSALYHQHPHHQHHRHSWTARRVLRTRSSATAHNVFDEQMLEHLAAYSPVSTRSHRINPVSSYQVQAALLATRRRESVNSSIGANSIRRLITLNNRNCRHKVPPHVRHKVCRSFTFLIIAHFLMSAILLPIFALQASNSVWHHREQWLQVGPNIGSFLLSIASLAAALMCLISIRLMRKLGVRLLMTLNCAALIVFLLCHLYPSIYTLLPAYLILGLTLSPAHISKIAIVVHFGSRISCSQHDCSFSSAHAAESLDEHKIFCHRDQKVRRLARILQTAQDFGLIAGACLAAVALACTTNDWNCFENSTPPTREMQSINSTEMARPLTSSSNFLKFAYDLPSFWKRSPAYFDDFYNLNDRNERVCGAGMCPMWHLDVQAVVLEQVNVNNDTIYTQFISGSARAGGLILIAIYLLLGLFALLSSLAMGKVQTNLRQDSFKTLQDTVLYAGPLAYFIGTEQAYMLGDFLRAFVSCSLGISMVSGALIGMGFMQLIVSSTLSMLLRHVKRIVVILAGFFFHSCLLLALYSWKPSSDDSALFYVLAASWGACNGMWETLLMHLVILNHSNHVAQAAAPLQALRFAAMGITFAAHGCICELPKIIIMGVLLILCVPPYAKLELQLEAQRKSQLNHL